MLPFGSPVMLVGIHSSAPNSFNSQAFCSLKGKHLFLDQVLTYQI